MDDDAEKRRDSPVGDEWRRHEAPVARGDGAVPVRGGEALEGVPGDGFADSHVPESGLLEALSAAFSYPWNGLEETLAPLRSWAGRGGAPERDVLQPLFGAAGAFEDLTAAQLAYTRLFIGSFKMEAPPYASYYFERDRTLNGRMAVEVEAVYAQFGLQKSSEEIAPADHLRYLLAFLALLARRFEETGEGAFAEAYADFRDEYVLSWYDRFQALVMRYAEQPYYPELVALIGAVLREEGE